MKPPEGRGELYTRHTAWLATGMGATFRAKGSRVTEDVSMHFPVVKATNTSGAQTSCAEEHFVTFKNGNTKTCGYWVDK